MAILAWNPHLKMRQRDGSFSDEYRVRAGRVEVRALDANGDPYPGYSDWVALTPEEVKLHFVRGTEVAEWLKGRMAPGGEAHSEHLKPGPVG